MFQRVSHSDSGFTLIEILAATAILSGVLLAFIRLMTDNIKVSREVELRTQSILLAEGEMERAKGALFSEFTTSDSWSTDLGNNYRATGTVVAVSSSTTLAQIDIAVGYDTDGDSTLETEERMVAITTYYGEH